MAIKVPGKISIRGKASFPKVKIKGTEKEVAKYEAKLRSRFISAFHGSVEQQAKRIDGLLDEAMDKAIWEWPRETHRLNNSIVGSPRNIVDLGELKKSKKIKTDYGKTFGALTVQYTAPYASFVHWGAYIYPYGNTSRGRVYTPARPWIYYALANRPTEDKNDIKAFVDALRKDMLAKLNASNS